MPLAQLSLNFQSLPLLPTSKLGPSGADSRVGGLVYTLGPCGSLQGAFLWEFLPLLPEPPQLCSVRDFEAYFLALELWVAWSVLLHSVPPSLSACECGTACYASLCLACRGPSAASIHQLPPCCESSPPLLPVWMNVPSLSPWSSGFHTVPFSGSSGYILILNLSFPSFGCARRHSVSASILVGSLFIFN